MLNLIYQMQNYLLRKKRIFYPVSLIKRRIIEQYPTLPDKRMPNNRIPDRMIPDGFLKRSIHL